VAKTKSKILETSLRLQLKRVEVRKKAVRSRKKQYPRKEKRTDLNFKL
jgi:hypothetical protein